MDAVNRVLGRSVVDLAQAVDDALNELAQAKGQQAACQQALTLADEDVAAAEAKVRAARDALFEEHPHLVVTQPQQPQVPTSAPTHGGPVKHPDPSALLPGQDPSKFEVVEVDDSDDPRFTAGFSPVSPSDDEDLPPVVWTEHEE